MLQRIKDSWAVLLGCKIAVNKDNDIVELEKLINEIYNLTQNIERNKNNGPSN